MRAVEVASTHPAERASAAAAGRGRREWPLPTSQSDERPVSGLRRRSAILKPGNIAAFPTPIAQRVGWCWGRLYPAYGSFRVTG